MTFDVAIVRTAIAAILGENMRHLVNETVGGEMYRWLGGCNVSRRWLCRCESE